MGPHQFGFVAQRRIHMSSDLPELAQHVQKWTLIQYPTVRRLAEKCDDVTGI